jgi:murein DD-endopeptidase MepM/ murein hydrolase activator NlpD
MTKIDRPWHRRCSAAGAPIALAVVLAGCASNTPAPVLSGAQAPPPPQQITVRRGDTLSGIAHAYHVPMMSLAEANHLTPPYRILAGQALIVPAGELDANRPAVAMVGPASPSLQPTPVPQSATAFSSPGSPPPLPSTPPPAPASSKLALGAETAIVPTPPQSGISANPENPSAPAPVPREPEQPSGVTAGAGPTAALERPPSGSHGMFLWPVRGHVIEGFGAGPDGTHNDGVNIAAPHGSAIEAADGGIVAYTGNELRGYGNLILIKHPGGWISAYAHCDLILVKTGQKVARGQVIARVGSTGNVNEPQLHFELRRGKKPVDPREYLAPLSTAESGRNSPS